MTHGKAERALDTAQSDGIPGGFFAKVVMINANGRHVMTVIPADRNVDLLKLRDVFETGNIAIDHERDFTRFFPDCQPGAMPPFGLLYNLPCYVDLRLIDGTEIFFTAGDHEETIGMSMWDYLRVVRPTVADLVSGD
jgi:Ala-tRNA(Pro) deacylase